MINKLAQAELFARLIHFGQKRRDGEDYIRHCERLAHAMGKQLFEKNESHYKYNTPFNSSETNMLIVGWLHDTIEDQILFEQVEFMKLINKMFGAEVYELVLTLTHFKDKETYNEYITKVFKHPIAWKIKWLDMIDNTSYNIPDKQKEKYHDACIMLALHGVDVPEILKIRLGLK